jgi:NTE family protein
MEFKMSRVLILSGGAFRGAIQVPVIKYLMENHEYDMIYGVSVGAVNGIMAAQKEVDVLEAIWNNLEKRGDFLKLQWYWPWHGLYSMKPLEKKLKKFTSLDKIKIPFSAGIVSFTDGEYYNLDSKHMQNNKELREAILASACMAGIMIPGTVEIAGEDHIGCDGGFRNIFPIPDLANFDYYDVVSCTPLDRMKMKNKKQSKFLLDLLLRSIEIFEDETFDKDLEELKCMAEPGTVRVFAPAEYPGDSLDASPEMIRKRFKLGEEAIKNPVIF